MEIDQVNNLKKSIKTLRSNIDNKMFDLRFSEAMTKDGIPFGNPKKIRDILNELRNQLTESETALDKAQQTLASKRAAIYKTDEYKNIK